MTYEDVKSALMISLAIALVAFLAVSCSGRRESSDWLAIGDATKRAMDRH